MDPIVIRAFASNVQATAPQPNTGFNIVTLNHVRAPNSATPGPNDSLFDRPQDGNVQLNLSNVTDKVAATFGKGKAYKITIEEDTA